MTKISNATRRDRKISKRSYGKVNFNREQKKKDKKKKYWKEIRDLKESLSNVV